MSATFSLALTASEDAASGQHYPQSTLYVVATPIGNLADMSLRALYVLTLVDVIACEDTRHTQALLRAYGIDKPSAQLMALHQHNELEASAAVVNLLREGMRVAFVSDAGTPGISDPGARLVAAVQAAGLRSLPLPGASSVTTLLSVAGACIDREHGQGFVFQGFLSSKATERDRAVAELSEEYRAVVLLEAPHRIEALLRSLAVLGSRQVTIGRELTKQFEEIATMDANTLSAWLEADANRGRGEFSLVIHPVLQPVNLEQDSRVLELLMPHLPLKTAVKLAAEITGQSRNGLYELALNLKQSNAITQPTKD